VSRGDGAEVPEPVRDLVDAYCDDAIDEAGFRALEAELLASGPARRYFADYFRLHAELGFAARARRASSSALERVAGPVRSGRGRASRRWLAAAGVLIAAGGFALGSWGWSGRSKAQGPNVAWLINAQDCRWADTGETPGRDMAAGKVLRLERGLAEVEFDRGARVILQGPATLELLAGNGARLLGGSISARVPARARGFTVLSPQGKVVDLGTEFGLSVAAGSTSVRVFSGALTAEVGDRGNPPVRLAQGQEASIDGRRVALGPGPGDGPARFARAIVPPPEIVARGASLDFRGAVAGSILDAEGRGSGLVARLPGTGSAFPGPDPNLRLVPASGRLELTTTRSDLNRQVGLGLGEYLGFRLADFGFTGAEDFALTAEVTDIPRLEVVGQFGLYAGVAGDRAIRGGVLRQPEADRYSLFLVNNDGGVDRDINEVGLTTTGDHLRLALRRTAGAYSLLVENLSRRSTNTLTIAPSTFLDGRADLHVGIFGANTQSDVRKTLTIRRVALTVLTRAPTAPP